MGRNADERGRTGMGPLRTLVIALQVLVGANAIAGGWAALSNPRSPFGIPVEALRRGPFQDFLIPGLALVLVLGLGHLASAAMTLFRARLFPYAIAVMGGVTVVWIFVQCYVMETVNPLQAAIFAVGVLEGLYACHLLISGRMFPFSLVWRILGKDGRGR
ncbi:MAG TPA: hypothetical protein VFL04_05480 [Rectinemataceae bacterium]|nr:hypothetical protein [Rectinemataceae bacterium]